MGGGGGGEKDKQSETEKSEKSYVIYAEGEREILCDLHREFELENLVGLNSFYQ